MGFFKKLGKGIKKVGKSVKKGIAKTVSRKARDFYRAGGEEGAAKRATEATAATALAEETQLKATQEQGQKDIAAAAATDAEANRIAAAKAAGSATAAGFGAASMAREAGLATPPVPPPVAPVAPVVPVPATPAPITPLTQRRSNSSPIRQLSPRQITQGKINPKAVDMKAINSLFNSPPKNNKNNINNKKK